ncbi:hypothetical protein D3C80_1743870 [compost metagenome]
MQADGFVQPEALQGIFQQGWQPLVRRQGTTQLVFVGAADGHDALQCGVVKVCVQVADTAQQFHARPAQWSIRPVQPGAGAVMPQPRLITVRVSWVLKVVLAGRGGLADQVLFAR